MSADSAQREPVRTLFSGPAGGVVGAFEIARRSGYDKIISFDMGGTSTDVCLCDGKIETTNEATIDHHPVATQMIGIHSVGAGGGSIAWVDEGGLLKVGPESAGADPGPVCYGKGSQVTVTDANLFLGRLDPDYFLGGELKLYRERIPEALEVLADELRKITGRTWHLSEIAEGIVRIANNQMESALRVISLQRGYDTRDFTLVSFGGAGGLHACDLAKSLLIPRVLVPQNPGALSALGILRSDIIQDASLTLVMATSDKDLQSKLQDQFASLEKDILQRMESHGFSAERVELERSIDVRYSGQSFELNIPYTDDFLEAFNQRHEQYYGYANRRLPTEIVNLRVRGRARHRLPDLPKFPLEAADPAEDALVQEKPVVLDGKPVRTGFYLRNKLSAGSRILGPAVVIEYSATTLLPTDYEARVDEYLNLLIEPRGNS
jgi:N-methylhydantoinase A